LAAIANAFDGIFAEGGFRCGSMDAVIAYHTLGRAHNTQVVKRSLHASNSSTGGKANGRWVQSSE
jgi:hypothetical protein